MPSSCRAHTCCPFLVHTHSCCATEAGSSAAYSVPSRIMSCLITQSLDLPDLARASVGQEVDLQCGIWKASEHEQVVLLGYLCCCPQELAVVACFTRLIPFTVRMYSCCFGFPSRSYPSHASCWPILQLWYHSLTSACRSHSGQVELRQASPMREP
jgi:hypothetical protein